MLASMERILGFEHYSALDARSNLKDTLWKQGRREDATILEESATDGSLKVLGVEHPTILICMKEPEDWKCVSMLNIRTIT